MGLFSSMTLNSLNDLFVVQISLRHNEWSTTRSRATERSEPSHVSSVGKTSLGLLQETLDEEAACDKKLTKIAEASVNVSAARA